MTKLLIADRDHNERAGISWLVSSYAIPFDKVLLAGSVAALFQIMETEIPDVVCIEIDMIPKDQWDNFRELTKRYIQKVIVMTAEATFERAIQGIELHAYDLWVKHKSPDYMKQVLNKCYKSLIKTKEKHYPDNILNTQSAVSYRSLFLPHETASTHSRLLLMQLENPKKQTLLLSFLQEYPFHNPPVLLPLSNMIVCVFIFDLRYPLKHLKHIGNRILTEWEERYSEPLSLVLYDTNNPSLSLNEKYLHARQALEIRFFKGYRQLSVIEEKVNWVIIDPFLTPSEQREWINMLNDADRDKLKHWMYQEFLNLTEPYPEPGLLRTRLTSILAQVRRFMKSHNLDEGTIEVRYHQVFETILYNPILYRIVQEFLLYLFEVFEQAKRHKDVSRKDIIEQAILYIEGHYHNPDLRLEDVASHVGRSPAYFSSLVTKRQGSSFRQLLTAIRIKEAQRLLLDTKISVQEIAEKTGFINANYFSKVFKGKMGITPRSYRNHKG
ncbi:AraC family transcriptional regulator [Peribacillus saganii]|uniref:AraC family transcriptional regulator n=1 Tax=Peribacillus saganii TaxID=2303992 RepID=A0A372LMX9_9BACI|nr:helix-turn-helix domain-containing protein [Peribacillus saganii]RFU68118.1 AraC family transcriptional regulator [Peribacillus saganii]